jgi:glycosyltransferase involved in cell wall biosynthesis
VKVLHVVGGLGAAYGGPSRVVRDISRALQRLGVEVHVATTNANGFSNLTVPLGQPVVEDGVTAWYFHRPVCSANYNYSFSWPLTLWLATNVQRFDFVHIHGLFVYAVLPASLSARHWQVPYAVTPHGILGRWGMRNRRSVLKWLSYQLIERRCLRGASFIHFTSEAEKQQAQRLDLGTRGVIIPPGLDLTNYDHLSDRNELHTFYPQLVGRQIVLYLGRLHPIKGLDLLLPAWKEVCAQIPQAILVIAGDGASSYVAQIRQQIAELALSENVLFTGFVSGETKIRLLAGCDLFVMPSYHESFGMSVVEALACGKPVVVSDQVAIHREISEAQAGLVVPCEIEQLTKALSHITTDVALRQRLGANSVRLVQTRFSIKATATALQQNYAATVEQNTNVGTAPRDSTPRNRAERIWKK